MGETFDHFKKNTEGFESDKMYSLDKEASYGQQDSVPIYQTEWFSFSPFCTGPQDIFYLGKSQVTVCYLYKVKISGLNSSLLALVL